MLSPDTILRAEPQYYETYAVFNCKRVTTEFLTSEEYKALESICQAPDELASISSKSGMTYRECEKFMKKMMQLGYVQFGLDYLRDKPVRKFEVNRELYTVFPIPFLSAPMSVDIFITNQCNLKCVHCFSSRDEQKVNQLSLKELQSTFDQLEMMGVFEVRITGGEPLQHPDIYEILRTLRARRFRKVILTNGTMLNEKIVGMLKESGIIPTVSLDDSRAKEHGLFRGSEGSFERTIKALDLLREFQVQYGINCCLHKRNIRRCAEIIEFGIRNGAYRIAFLDLKPVGRMKNNIDWVPSRKEYEESLVNLTLMRFKYRGKIDVSLDALLECRPLRESIAEAKRGYVSCHAGKTRMAIDSSGSIYPCNVVISDPKWNMGNIRREEIQSVWFSSKWLFFRGGVKINDLKDCRKCRKLRTCSYFYCRLLPYVENDDELSSSSKCE